MKMHNAKTIHIFKNKLDDLPYQDFWSVDLLSASGQLIERVGTYDSPRLAAQEAYALAAATGTMVVNDA